MTEYHSLDDDTYSMVHRHFDEGSLLKKCSFSLEKLDNNNVDFANSDEENETASDNDSDDSIENFPQLNSKNCLFK